MPLRRHDCAFLIDPPGLIGWMRRTIVALAVGALLGGCGGSDGRVGTGSPAGSWVDGDLHVHTSVGSNDTRYPDGSVRSFPETIARIARERGLDFVVLTDHSNSTGGRVDTTEEDPLLWNVGPEFPLWDAAAALSGTDLVMIDGTEYSPVSRLAPEQCPGCPTTGTEVPQPVGHIGCLPLDLDSFDRGGSIVDRPPGAVPGSSGIDQCHARGGLAVLNHPFFPIAPWIEYDWTSFAYDAVEVWNGSLAATMFDAFAYDAYLCDRLAGRKVSAVGGSDNHRTPVPYLDRVGITLGAPLGLPVTSVFVARLVWPDIVAAVRAGRVVIHERGSFVEFEIHRDDGTYLAGIGASITAPAGAVTVSFHGEAPRGRVLRLWRAAPGSCDDARRPGRDLPPVVDKEILIERNVCEDGACQFAFSEQLGLAPGLVFATLGDFPPTALNVREVAVTNVVELSRPALLSLAR